MPGFVAQMFHPDLTGSKFGAAESGQDAFTLGASGCFFVTGETLSGNHAARKL